MNTQHTPGPWAFAKYSAKRFGLGRCGEGAFFLLQCVHDSADDPQAKADARLIAAAPELLEALQEIAADYADRFDLDDPSTNPGIKSTIKLARAAIAKATGASNG